jgi:hypothetical protein
MEPETKIGIRVGFELAVGGGCMIALIAGKGMLEHASIAALCIFGGAAFVIAAFELGWHKARTARRRLGKIFAILILVCVSVSYLGYFIWTHGETERTRASLHIEGLPGFFGYVVIKLTDAPSTQRQYVLEMRDQEGAWASLYISASNLFTFSITDTHGEVYPLEVELSNNGISLDQWIYIQCEAGVSGGKTIMAVSVNGRVVGSRIINGALDLGDRNWGKGGGTIGADRQHQQFGKFSIAEIAGNSSTWTSEEQKRGNKYIEQKYMINLSPEKD